MALGHIQEWNIGDRDIETCRKIAGTYPQSTTTLRQRMNDLVHLMRPYKYRTQRMNMPSSSQIQVPYR